MNEKKLTDEEIVKAWEYCLVRQGECENCPCEDWGCAIGNDDILDLLHRLQSKNEGLKAKNKLDQMDIEDLRKEREKRVEEVYADFMQDYKIMREEWNACQNELAKECEEHEEFTQNAKAEIERLTEENERIAWSKQEYLDWVHGFLSTHTEMKDRGEDYKMFDRDWMCNVFWEKIVGSIEYIIDLENQRNELQKQVDELTLKNDCLRETVQWYDNDIKKVQQQAVKDTAKEIFSQVLEWIPICEGYGEFIDNLESWIKERYGVEVE